MKRKLQVFISSTYTDLKEERQAAVEAILSAGHIPAGMELFAANDESQLETIKRWIDDSDVFMLILGGRYGSIEKASGKSYTQLEYEYATERKRSFAAIMSDTFLDAKVKGDLGKDALELVHGHKRTEFLNLVKSKTSRFFTDLNGLKVIVFESLGVFDKDESLPGWVKGTEAINPKPLLEENAQLKEELISIRQMIRQLSPEEMLSQEARSLVIEVANGGGSLFFHIGSQSAALRTGMGEKTMKNQREIAVWKAAIEELFDLQMIEDIGHEHVAFRLTRRGFEFADKLSQSTGAALPADR